MTNAPNVMAEKIRLSYIRFLRDNLKITCCCSYSLCEANGTILKEYAAVPEELLKNTQELEKFFVPSVVYVKGLEPITQKKGKAIRKRTSE